MYNHRLDVKNTYIYTFFKYFLLLCIIKAIPLPSETNPKRSLTDWDSPTKGEGPTTERERKHVGNAAETDGLFGVQDSTYHYQGRERPMTAREGARPSAYLYI